MFVLSKDNIKLKIKCDTLSESEVVQGFVEEIEEDDIVIPLPNVQADILKKIIYYGNNGIDNIFNDYLKNDNTLFDIMLGANYLNMPKLLDYCAEKVADELKRCKTTEEIRKRFNIENDFTPEEEERIENEYQWCEKMKQ